MHLKKHMMLEGSVFISRHSPSGLFDFFDYFLAEFFPLLLL